MGKDAVVQRTGQRPALASSYSRSTVSRRDTRLLHQQGDLLDLRIVARAVSHMAQRLEITADNLLFAGFAHGVIVADTESHHVHAHIRRRLIGALAVDRGEERIQDGIDLHVAVVVHRRLAVGLQVERIDHVNVLQVGRSRLIRHIQRVLKRQVPNRESLELRITGFVSVCMLVIELAQAHRHLSASRTRRRDNDKRTRGLHEIIPTETILRSNEVHIMRIAVDDIMIVHANTFAL